MKTYIILQILLFLHSAIHDYELHPNHPDDRIFFYQCTQTKYPDIFIEAERKANNGSAHDCYNLGNIWLSINDRFYWETTKKSPYGKVGARCHQIAISWYEKGAALNDPLCAAILVRLYENCFTNYYQNEQKYTYYSHKAYSLLSQNAPTAQHLYELMSCYALGIGTSQDLEKAKIVYNKYLIACKSEKIEPALPRWL